MACGGYAKVGRRGALLGIGAAMTLGGSTLALARAPTEKRLVVVVLRGAMDGLASVVPYGDPALAAHRAALVPPGIGQEGGLLDLGGFFGLHPALAGMHAMYGRGELLPVHAVAGPYRSRSHFEAQDLLEGGADHRLASGWLNRAAMAIPPTSPGGYPLSMGVSTPLLLRGPAPTGAYAPTGPGLPPDDLYLAVARLHRSDPLTGQPIRDGLQERGFTIRELGARERTDLAGRSRGSFPALASAAGKLLASADGPRIAAMELGGWDTHADQARRVGQPLTQLDQGMVALMDGLGAAWRDTVVLVLTEFGRTVRVNGTGGTDHGTGGAAFVLGGPVLGGRVLADWPGLGGGRLLEDRDLQPSMDFRSLARGLLSGHLGLSAADVDRALPGHDVTLAGNLLRRPGPG